MNKIFLIGNLTRDPELRATKNGKSVCTFNIAVNKRFAQENETAQFYRINAWGKLGETAEKYLAKGRKVAVVGELEGRLYSDKNGNAKISLDVNADEIEFLTPRGSTETPVDELTVNDLSDIRVDDLPFV